MTQHAHKSRNIIIVFLLASLIFFIYHFQAFILLELARVCAHRGSSIAQMYLGDRYFELSSLYAEKSKENYKMAYDQLIQTLPTKKGPEKANAEYLIGTYYKCGRGMIMDNEKAKEWFLKAQADGNMFAKNALIDLEKHPCTQPYTHNE